MEAIKFYIYDEVSFTTSVIEFREWLAASAIDQQVSSLLLTVFSELGQNIIKYADRGTIELNLSEVGNRRMLELRVKDKGPGIADIAKALSENYSTSGTLGLGLPGVKRIMDELDIQSEPKQGTQIRAVKYL